MYHLEYLFANWFKKLISCSLTNDHSFYQSGVKSEHYYLRYSLCLSSHRRTNVEPWCREGRDGTDTVTHAWRSASLLPGEWAVWRERDWRPVALHSLWCGGYIVCASLPVLGPDWAREHLCWWLSALHLQLAVSVPSVSIKSKLFFQWQRTEEEWKSWQCCTHHEEHSLMGSPASGNHAVVVNTMCVHTYKHIHTHIHKYTEKHPHADW